MASVLSEIPGKIDGASIRTDDASGWDHKLEACATGCSPTAQKASPNSVSAVYRDDL